MTLPDPVKKKAGEHLEDLRRAIVTSLAAVGILAAVAWLFSGRLVDWLLEPARRVVEGPLYFFGPTDAFMVRMYAAIAAGTVAASPIIAYQIWQFIDPGLHANEKRSILPWAAVTAVLFVIGSAFGYFLILPTTLTFTMSFATSALRPMLSVREYTSFATDLVLASGVAFDFPVVVVAAVAMGLTRTATLARFRRHSYVSIFVLSAILTPPDVSSQFLLAVPMLVLFEGSLIVAKFFEKNRVS
ncbi:MAG: twin-arginine translocase subunit TatC [Candidatus Omnitrophica bacterium]|nr:twin-arginine translocase subunit TatC [Candidatus Omnitrophota bacterium]